jgi:hypothetical protein
MQRKFYHKGALLTKLKRKAILFMTVEDDRVFYYGQRFLGRKARLFFRCVGSGGLRQNLLQVLCPIQPLWQKAQGVHSVKR